MIWSSEQASYMQGCVALGEKYWFLQNKDEEESWRGSLQQSIFIGDTSKFLRPSSFTDFEVSLALSLPLVDCFPCIII